MVFATLLLAAVVASPSPALTPAPAAQPQSISLQQAVTVGLANTPTLQEAKSNVQYYAAEVRFQHASELPLVSLGATTTRYYEQRSASFNIVSPAGYPLWYTSNGTTVTLSQLVFDGGQVRSRVASERAIQSEYAQTYRRTAQQVAYNIAVAYYNVLTAQQTITAYEQVLRQDILEENVVRAQIHAGVAAGAALATQQATTAMARTQLAQEHGLLAQYLATLATTMGLRANTLLAPQDDTGGLNGKTPSVAVPEFTQALNTAYANRPDLQSAIEALDSAQDLLHAAALARNPSVSATLTKGVSSTSMSGSNFGNTASGGLSLSIPVYDDALSANVLASRATVGYSNSFVHATQLTVQQDVQNAITGLTSAIAVLASSRAQYVSALTSLNMTEGQFKAGVTSIEAVVQAEATYTTSVSSYISALYSERQAEQAMRFALGTIV